MCQWQSRWGFCVRGVGDNCKGERLVGVHAYVEDLAHPSLCLAEGFEVHVAEVVPYLLDDLDRTRLERHGWNEVGFLDVILG